MSPNTPANPPGVSASSLTYEHLSSVSPICWLGSVFIFSMPITSACLTRPEPTASRAAQIAAEPGDRDADERAAEVLRHEAAVEVADEDAVDVGQLQAGAGHGRQRGVADQLFEVEGVELAEGRVAPADDVRVGHVRALLWQECGGAGSFDVGSDSEPIEAATGGSMA